MLGVPIRDDSSDSQDLNRLIETLIHRRGLSLPEAMELAVPPIVNEIRQFPEELRGFYMYLRQAMGPFAQGPIALIARNGDEYVFSVDALGLRPLWEIHAEDAYVFSSEPGVVPLADMTGEPKPLSPGEKVMVRVKRDNERAAVTTTRRCRSSSTSAGSSARAPTRVAGFEQAIPTGGPLEGPEIPGYDSAGPVRAGEGRGAGCWPAWAGSARTRSSSSRWRPTGPSRSARSATTARSRRCRRSARTSPTTSRRRSRSSPTRRSTASARSSTSRAARCSARGPSIDRPQDEPRTIETAFPILLGGHHDMAPLSDEVYRAVAREHKTYLLEDLWECFRGRAGVIDISCLEAETVEGALERLKFEAAKKVLDGCRAAGALRPHRLRGRAAVARSAPRAGRDRPRAARVPRRGRARRTCAAARRSCCARARSATCTTSAWRSAWARTASAPT